MATTVNITSTFPGDIEKKYILKSLVGGETLSISGIKMKENVKYKWKPRTLSSGNLVQSGTTSFSATGTLTIAEVELEPKKFKINTEIDFNDIYELIDSQDMGAGANAEQMPDNLNEGLSEVYTSKMAQEIEGAIWTGKTSIGIAGLNSQLGSAIRWTGATSAETVTVATVVSIMNNMLRLQPAGVKKKGKQAQVFIVDYATAEAYDQALQAQGINTSQESQKLTKSSIEVIPVGGLPANSLRLLSRDNIAFATDLTSDYNEVKLIDMRDTTGDDKVRYILKGKLDVAFIAPNEVVYFSRP